MMRLSPSDRIGEGSFADIFAPDEYGQAFKVFRRAGGSRDSAPRVFSAETIAYERVQGSPKLRACTPTYFGPVRIEAIVDPHGADMSAGYWLDLCYAMSRIPPDPEERKFGSFYGTRAWKMYNALEKAFKEVGVGHLGDASVLHWRSDKPIILDFATYDAAAFG